MDAFLSFFDTMAQSGTLEIICLAAGVPAAGAAVAGYRKYKKVHGKADSTHTN